MSWLRFEQVVLRGVVVTVAWLAHGCLVTVLRVVSQVSGADIAHPYPVQRKLPCELTCQTFGGIAVATARPLPGHDSDLRREISPDVLPDVSRPSRGRLAGLRATSGEI
ncbi:MAG: hypothetical protein WBS33_04455 [Verrucomicrobiia bacterium]